MATNLKKDLVITRDINFLNKDFNSFRKDLLEYSKTHFSDKNQDFSENGLGGMFIDMAAYVGDVMSYYLDHQFNELSLETAVETDNILRLVRNSGIDIRGASPAFAEIDFYAKIPAKIHLGEYIPDDVYLCKILPGTKLSTISGVEFELVEEIDLNERDRQGFLTADYQIGDIDSNNNPINFIVKKAATVTSAASYREVFEIDNRYVPFRTISLNQADVNEITSVVDSDSNTYYEVNSLVEDTVFLRVNNFDYDLELVPESVKVVSAPRRYVSEFDFDTKTTKIRFGSGRSDNFESENITNPSDNALPLFGDKSEFKVQAIDPGIFLETNTLGVTPVATNITVNYRAGGAQSHNVSAGSINSVKTLLTSFSDGGSTSLKRGVRNSIEVLNQQPARGGSDAPTVEELRQLAFSFQGSQNRIVTKSDLIARIYTMPVKFGRVFRAGIVRNIKNPRAVTLSLICLDASGKLTIASDTLKKNIATYLNEFRLISDSYDIVDATIANIAIEIDIVADANYNDEAVKASVITRLKDYFRISNFQIDQPISKSEVSNLVYTVKGVTEVMGVDIKSRSGILNGRSYSTSTFSVSERTLRNNVFPPIGGIFEVKFLNNDISVRAR